MEDNKNKPPLFGIIKLALEDIGYQNMGSASIYLSTYAGATFETGFVSISNSETIPVYLWATGSPVPPDFVHEIGEKRSKEGAKGALFVSPTPYPIETVECLGKYGYYYITFDDIEQKLDTKLKKTDELMQGVKREKNELLKKGGYSKSEMYRELVSKVDNAKDNVSKKNTLEALVAFFAQDIGLNDVETGKRTPSSEIDVRARNERTVGIWGELGTPIIFEAKNWDCAVSADEIRNLVGKVKPAKTRFIIAWNGITGKDELKGARLEIIKAKVAGTFVLVLVKQDFEKIVSGFYPETIVEEKYYSLINDRVL